MPTLEQLQAQSRDRHTGTLSVVFVEFARKKEQPKPNPPKKKKPRKRRKISRKRKPAIVREINWEKVKMYARGR